MTVKRYKGKLPLSTTREFASQAIQFSYKLKELNQESIRCRIALREFHFVFDPELITEILKDNDGFKKSFVYDYLAMVLGKGLLTEEGHEWKANRRKMQPVFSPKGISQLFLSMDKKIKEESDNLGNSGEVHCLDFMRNMAAKVVIYALFSEEKNADDLSNLINRLINYANYRLKTPFAFPTFMPTSRNMEFKKDRAELQEFIQNIITQRKNADSPKDDFLSYLMEIKTEDGPYFSNEQLLDELVTLYVAGQETTASVLTFAVYELMRNPDVLAQMQQEIDALEDLTFENLSQLKVTENVLYESMRMYPPGWGVSREAVRDFSSKGLTINKGESIFLPIYLLHHDEGVWKEPTVFKPDRFNEKPNDFYYMPFGTGPRVCIGKYFALIEMKIIFYHLFKRYNFSIPQDYKLELQTPLTLCPKKDFKLSVEKRT